MFRLDFNDYVPLLRTGMQLQGQQQNVVARRRADDTPFIAGNSASLDFDLLKTVAESPYVTRSKRIEARERIRTDHLGDGLATQEMTELFALETTSLSSPENQEKVVSRILNKLPDFLQNIGSYSDDNHLSEQDYENIKFAHTILKNDNIFEQAYKLTGDSREGERARGLLNKLWEMIYIVDGLPRKEVSPLDLGSKEYQDSVRTSKDGKVLYIDNKDIKNNDPEDVRQFVADYVLVKKIRENLKGDDNPSLPIRFFRWASGGQGIGKYKIHDMMEAHYVRDIRKAVWKTV